MWAQGVHRDQAVMWKPKAQGRRPCRGFSQLIPDGERHATGAAGGWC